MSNDMLSNRCTTNTNIDADTFVGLKCKGGNYQISFPLGFDVNKSNDIELRNDILLLFNVLSKYTDRRESEINAKELEQYVKAPIYAYLYLINDYFARGYYKERDTRFEVAKRGKINWGKTIKTQKTYIQGEDVFYLNFVTKKNTINENEMITLIHEYCVYESFDKFGWIFTAFLPPKPRIKFNKNLFLGIIKEKLTTSFNDRNKQLFKNMLYIVQSLGDDGSANDFKYGTNRFEYVWEKMIDKAYGIHNKEEFFPKTQWEIDNKIYKNSYLEPDTIMLANDNIYVLDAKYYKYGWTKNHAHLPDSSSIGKQITYGEYIATIEQNKTIYNAFIMPYNAYGNTFHTEKELHYIGTATSDWKSSDGTKSYEQIIGILLDVKSLMKTSPMNNAKLLKLANLIEEKQKMPFNSQQRL